MFKGTPIHVHLLGDPDVKRFAEVAQKVCNLFERVDDLPKVQFLQQLEELLPLAYSLAHRIPEPYDWSDDDDEEWEPGEYELGPEGIPRSERLAREKEFRFRIIAKLGWHSFFHFVYDPVDPNDREPIGSTLAYVLAEIYVDLKNGLILYARPSDEEKAQALSDWRFDLALGWGRHVAEALLPIHSLIHNHYDEDDEVFRA